MTSCSGAHCFESRGRHLLGLPQDRAVGLGRELGPFLVKKGYARLVCLLREGKTILVAAALQARELCSPLAQTLVVEVGLQSGRYCSYLRSWQFLFALGFASSVECLVSLVTNLQIRTKRSNLWRTQSSHPFFVSCDQCSSVLLLLSHSLLEEGSRLVLFCRRYLFVEFLFLPLRKETDSVLDRVDGVSDQCQDDEQNDYYDRYHVVSLCHCSIQLPRGDEYRILDLGKRS